MKIHVAVDEDKKKLKDHTKDKKKFTTDEIEDAIRILAERL